MARALPFARALLRAGALAFAAFCLFAGSETLYRTLSTPLPWRLGMPWAHAFGPQPCTSCPEPLWLTDLLGAPLLLAAGTFGAMGVALRRRRALHAALLLYLPVPVLYFGEQILSAALAAPGQSFTTPPTPWDALVGIVLPGLLLALAARTWRPGPGRAWDAAALRERLRGYRARLDALAEDP